MASVIENDLREELWGLVEVRVRSGAGGDNLDGPADLRGRLARRRWGGGRWADCAHGPEDVGRGGGGRHGGVRGGGGLMR